MRSRTPVRPQKGRASNTHKLSASGLCSFPIPPSLQEVLRNKMSDDQQPNWLSSGSSPALVIRDLPGEICSACAAHACSACRASFSTSLLSNTVTDKGHEGVKSFSNVIIFLQKHLCSLTETLPLDLQFTVQGHCRWTWYNRCSWS